MHSTVSAINTGIKDADYLLWLMYYSKDKLENSIIVDWEQINMSSVILSNADRLIYDSLSAVFTSVKRGKTEFDVSKKRFLW